MQQPTALRHEFDRACVMQMNGIPKDECHLPGAQFFSCYLCQPGSFPDIDFFFTHLFFASKEVPVETEIIAETHFFVVKKKAVLSCKRRKAMRRFEWTVNNNKFT